MAGTNYQVGRGGQTLVQVSGAPQNITPFCVSIGFPGAPVLGYRNTVASAAQWKGIRYLVGAPTNSAVSFFGIRVRDDALPVSVAGDPMTAILGSCVAGNYTSFIDDFSLIGSAFAVPLGFALDFGMSATGLTFANIHSGLSFTYWLEVLLDPNYTPSPPP